MQIRDTVVTLHPLATQGGVDSDGFDFDPAAERFQELLHKRLARAGFDVRVATEGASDQGIRVATQLVRVEPGRGGQRFLLGPLITMLAGGAAVFEVEGVVGQGDAPLARLHGVGKNFNAGGKVAVKYAATDAALAIAKQVIKALEAR